MVGNSSKDTDLCYTPSVVFCNGARALAPEEGEGVAGLAQPWRFELFFGAADAVVGSAVVELTIGQDGLA